MSKAQKPIVMKGKLTFKGSGARKAVGASRSKTATVPVSLVDPSNETEAKTTEKGNASEPVSELDGLLTETQRKHMKRKQELEGKALTKDAAISYRQRIEEFNSKLSSLTEHNDLPRISAAGNG